MNSIKTKTALLTASAVIVTMVVVVVLGIGFVRNLGQSSAEQMQLLLCETGEKNLDGYFRSVEQSVTTVATYAKADLSKLDALDTASLEGHVQRMREIFANAADRTSGVLTYYYRMDPTVCGDVRGFWSTNLDGRGFVPHEVTDISLYDTTDTSTLVWFTVPKVTGKSIWQPPYITDNLDVRVISYNMPVYRDNTFVGVAGMEIDYNTVAEQVSHIKLFDSGFAFVTDADGGLIYHPTIDVASLEPDEIPAVPEGLMHNGEITHYTYDGMEKQAVWLPLSNDMRLYVTVPVSEINASWQQFGLELVGVSAILAVVFIAITLRFAGHITRPLQDLTKAAEQLNAGNYAVELNYEGNDEVATLTKTVNKLVGHLETYITDLNSLAYADALTSVRNKGAFDIHVRELQVLLDDAEGKMGFAVGVFDCDNLKQINDLYGHDKGDEYLKAACNLICDVYRHSPVFRIGGDEFAVILRGDDYRYRDERRRTFERRSREACEEAGIAWEEIHVSAGIAVYEPEEDESVSDVVRRADKLMYDDKRLHKTKR